MTRIVRDFPDPATSRDVITLVSEADESERVQAAIVLWARGDTARLLDILELTRQDRRDTLARAGLEHEDWREVLDAELG